MLINRRYILFLNVLYIPTYSFPGGATTTAQYTGDTAIYRGKPNVLNHAEKGVVPFCEKEEKKSKIKTY